jgi:uncharacterized protein (TIGR03435 family)
MARFIRRVCGVVAVAGLILSGAAGVAQNLPKNSDVSGPRAAFDVASIRPGDSDNGSHHINTRGGNLDASATVKKLIEMAYGIHDVQIEGAPAWVENAKYDIVAKSDELEDPSQQTPEQSEAHEERQKQRVQSLLADRFQLKFHSEVRQMPLFALVIAKGGPKLDAPKAGEVPRIGVYGALKLDATDISMAQFADECSYLGIDRLVVDKTGLTGRYDLKLQWTPDSTLADSAAPDSNQGSIFTALQEQAGLKLEPQKGPVEVMVIDHIERPSAN